MTPFPEDVLKLGHYLGSNIDVGPAMMAKILTQNEQVPHRSTYRLLTPDETSDKKGQMLRIGTEFSKKSGGHRA